MHRLFPPAASPDAGQGADQAAALAGLTAVTAVEAVRSQPCPAGRADGGPRWVYTNMIASADGAASLGGTSGGLGGAADREMFWALRAAADVIVVGAGTVRAERYHLPRVPSGQLATLRAGRRNAAPVLCVVSASLRLGPDLPFLTELAARTTASGDAAAPVEAVPMIATTDNAVGEGAALEALGCELVAVGAQSVDLAALLDRLADRGLVRVLCEGGPTLLGHLAERDLIDEWNFTISPRIVGGMADRAVTGARELGGTMSLHQLLLAEDSTLFARYVRASSQMDESSAGITSS